VALVPVIDCGDRVVLDLEVTKSQDASAVRLPVARALAKVFGTPSHVPSGLEVRSDHGPQYTGADCENLCKAWHIEHTFAPVGRPTGNAVAERFPCIRKRRAWSTSASSSAMTNDRTKRSAIRASSGSGSTTPNVRHLAA